MAASSFRSWPVRGGLHRQHGQAMVYGLFMLAAVIAALFFLFNTGQLVREKTKLVNTSDAVAYSSAVMQARTLNYQAYANRAMLANTVAIAQLVSLASWLEHVKNMADWGASLSNPKFAAYYPSYVAALGAGTILNAPGGNPTVGLELMADFSDGIVQNLLSTAQDVAHAGLTAANKSVMEQVAAANYLNDGTVSVEAVSLASGNSYAGFVTDYSGTQRTRFAEAAQTAADKDGFVSHRSWSMPGLWSDCGAATATGRVDWLDRRGGTNLIGFDDWKALDTLSEKRWVPSGKYDIWCSAVAENPQAFGAREAADNPVGYSNATWHDSAPAINPGASADALLLSAAASWSYSGLPAYYDLSSYALKQDDPRLKVVVKLKRSISETMTAEGRSQIRNSGSNTRLAQALNAYEAQPADGDALVAVSGAEVYFERPASALDNIFGAGLGKPREIGSLFNPYWQVRLIQPDAEIRQIQKDMGAELP